MKRFRRWIASWRWAARARRAREWRNDCSFSQRARFDDMLRPPINGTHATLIAYPDALYRMTADDLDRATIATGEPCYRKTEWNHDKRRQQSAGDPR